MLITLWWGGCLTPNQRKCFETKRSGILSEGRSGILLRKAFDIAIVKLWSVWSIEPHQIDWKSTSCFCWLNRSSWFLTVMLSPYLMSGEDITVNIRSYQATVAMEPTHRIDFTCDAFGKSTGVKVVSITHDTRQNDSVVGRPTVMTLRTLRHCGWGYGAGIYFVSQNTVVKWICSWIKIHWMQKWIWRLMVEYRRNEGYIHSF